MLGSLVEKTESRRLQKIENILAEEFDYNLAFPSTVAEMYITLNNIKQKKDKIMLESNFNDYMNNEVYNILNLAQEAINLKIKIEGQDEKTK